MLVCGLHAPACLSFGARVHQSPASAPEALSSLGRPLLMNERIFSKAEEVEVLCFTSMWP